MALSYKTATTRHDDLTLDDLKDVAGAVPVYVAGYGPASRLEHVREKKSGNDIMILHFADEYSSERMDVTVMPEALVDAALHARYASHFSWLADLVLSAAPAGELPYKKALGRQSVPRYANIAAKPTSAARHCDEHAYRGMVLRELLRLHRRAEYRVYAALSPFHERTVKELTEVVNARSFPVGLGSMSEADVAATLSTLESYSLACRLAYVPLEPISVVATGHSRMPDYDHGLGRRVRDALRNSFPLAPGTVLTDRAYLENHRAEFRRSVNTYRHERILELLRSSSDRLAELADYIQNASKREAAIQARNATPRRVLVEHEVVRDILRAHHLGTELAAAGASHPLHAADSGVVDIPLGDPIVRKTSLPRPVALIINTCSQLPDTLIAASPRSESGRSTPGTNDTSAANTPRRCNSWEAYTSVDANGFNDALMKALAEITTN